MGSHRKTFAPSELVEFAVLCGTELSKAEEMLEVYIGVEEPAVPEIVTAKLFDIRVDNFAPCIADVHREAFTEWVISPSANIRYNRDGTWTEKGQEPGGNHDITTDGLYDFWVVNVFGQEL